MQDYLNEACALAELAQTLENWESRIGGDLSVSFHATAQVARRCAQKFMELDRLDQIAA